ncbi:hypothetical protein [Microbacterium cremeum]|uniref:hypothetical protein n=1 Tax=Microbacterium cremeum TaxID=2782169 RepID=UPI001886FC1F|nr:hypothetical protein [Microbacterium cremeum]
MPRRHTAALAAGALILLAATGCTASEQESAPTPSPSKPAKATPSPTPTSAANVEATCDNTATDAFQTLMAEREWVSWRSDVGMGSMFDQFPEGAPNGSLTCTWGADPDLATDNVITLAWAPLDPAIAAATQEHLVSLGYERIEAREGVYLAMPGDTDDPGMAQWLDDDGYGQAYLFTGDDVRWALYRDELAFIKAPHEPVT